MAAVLLYLAVAITSLAYAYYHFLYRTLKKGEPPLASGHWLWGNGKQFKEHAVNFLNGTRNKLGDVFTVRFFHQYWTMVLDVHSFERFSREKNFDFELVQEQVNGNVFHFQLKNGRKMIQDASKKVNGKYLFEYMEHFAKNVSRTLKNGDHEVGALATTVTSDKTVINNSINDKQTQGIYDELHKNPADMNIERLLTPDAKLGVDENDGWVTSNLRGIASDTFFAAVFYTIFGHGKPEDKTAATWEPHVVYKNFDIFHKYFNYLWLGMPHMLFPKAGEAATVLAQQPSSSEMVARDGCSEYIKTAIECMKKDGQSEGDIIGHNLVFLHVNYNTFRTVFWCMYKMMDNPKVMTAVRKELDEVIEAKRSGDALDNAVDLTVEDINKMPVLDSFLKEIFRWSSGVFMVRYCIGDTAFTTEDGKTYNIRKGDKVAIYPPAIHKDPEIFENPEDFQYDRFINKDFYKNGKKIKHPVIGFGSLCPGQKLSILEIKWFVINLINSYKMELVEGESCVPNTAMYGHEILPPTNDVQTRMKKREGECRLNFLNNYGATA